MSDPINLDNTANEPQSSSPTVLKGNSFDAKIGYDKRAAAKQDLTVILQDVEGTQLTDEAGADLITEIEGFVTTELTSEKALSVTLPTETRIVSRFYSYVFGESFSVVKQFTNPQGQIVNPYIEIVNPEPTWRYVNVNSRVEVATGEPLYETIDGQQKLDGHEFETFLVAAVNEIPDPNTGDFTVRYTLDKDPTYQRDITYMRRLILKERTGVLKVEEVFPVASEVSSTLLGVDRAETQLSLFSNVSTYGFNSDEFVFYTDNPANGPSVWVNRQTETGEPHYPATIDEVKNEGALRVSTYPVPYNFPYPPLTQNIVDGVDVAGLYNPDAWGKWQNFVQLGKSLYEYYLSRRNLQQQSSSPDSNYQKYNNFLSRFLPAINEWDDNSHYNGQFYGNNSTRYYRQISIWTNTWAAIKREELRDPVSNDPIGFVFLSLLSLDLRGTGTSTGLGDGSVDNLGATGPNRDLNPFQENWVNREWSSASEGGDPGQDDFIPGYGATGGHFALLQSRQAFRYQPGRISGYTYGTRATMDKTEGENYAEWGIFNDFDEYVFRREGANFYIVRRSNIVYPISFLQELGLADELGNPNPSFVRNYTKTIGGKIYNMQEIKLGKERFNGDSLNGNGPSGYLLNTDEITMYKIEFGWYGAIGLRMYAYVPVDSGEARWVVVHTFVIENKLNVPSMGDPFFRFKYEVRIGSGQGPDLTQPQVLYKYGTSMYIDGGDEGTVNVFTETSDTKQLPSSGDYTSIFGVYPKRFITSGGGDLIPNKKIIIPKQMSITADGFAEINVVKCRGCQGSSYLYMPNVTASTNGDIRKFNKLDPNNASSSLTLAPIDKTTIGAVSASTTITVGNADYLRPGDYLLDNIDGILVTGLVQSRIVSITENGGNYDIVLENIQSIGDAEIIRFQPTFIVDDNTRRQYGLDYHDFKAKVIYSKIPNTYISNVTSGAYNETADLIQYIFSDRHNLETERELDPTKIGTLSGVNFTPADFFASSGTFDARLSQGKVVIGSPNPVSGPNSLIKFLNPVPRESTGQVKEWIMGFTPNRPLYDITGELTGWQRPDGSIITEDRNGTPTNVKILPPSEMVYLDYHPYETSRSYIGYESGEGWGSRIHPFTEDFRIGNPPGSNSGICSVMTLNKNEPVEVEVTQVDNTTLQDLLSTGAVPFNKWTGFDNVADLNSYLASSNYFLQSESPIILGAGDPTGGQIALKQNDAYITIFYDAQSQTDDARFSNIQISYTEGSGAQTQVRYIVPVNYDIANALDSNLDPLVVGSNFLIAYNSVQLRAWFSGGGSQYDSPNSYTAGPGSNGIFEFNAFPLYAFAVLKDGASINCAEVHDVDLLGKISTYNPQWKYTFIDGNPAVTYTAGTNNQTGELNVNGVGTITQTPPGVDDLVPSAFTQVSRLSSSQIDRQGSSLLRPGNTLTTLYINNETKTFDLSDVFGFDRKVITPDIVNTEAVYLVGKSLDNTPIDIQVNLTYVEQL